MSQVGPIGVSPSFRTPPPCSMSGTSLPFTIVVPFTLFSNGLVWAMWFA